MHLPAVVKRLKDSCKHGDDMYFPDGRVTFVWKYTKWQWHASFGPTVNIPESEKITVIILNYKRPHNMQPIVRSVLRCSFVKKLIVCNNDPLSRIEEWISASDKRVVLLNNSRNGGTIARFEIASKEDGTYFLAIDDDIFLYPEQIRTLFRHLLKDPSVPHGVYGQRLVGHDQFVDAIHGIEERIDILNRVYAFTKTHVVELFRLLSVIGIQDKEWGDLTKGDDMVLSFTGETMPICHDVGEILDCPSEGIPGIAVWKERDFVDYRRNLLTKLRQVRNRTSYFLGSKE